METLFKDIRFGLRSLRKRPGFTAVVVLTLALGIGANTAIFSVIYSVLIKPLPFHRSDRIVLLWGDDVGQREFCRAVLAQSRSYRLESQAAVES